MKITRHPIGVIHGVNLSLYRLGEVYDLPPALAEYLVLEQYAILEMRDHDKPPVPVEVERRRQS